MLDYEDITLEMIGKGGAVEDVPVARIVEEELRRLAWMVHERGRGDAGKVILSIAVKAEGDANVIFVPQVKTTEPARDAKALSAIVCGDGSVVSVQHKQQELPNVTPITKDGGDQ